MQNIETHVLTIEKVSGGNPVTLTQKVVEGTIEKLKRNKRLRKTRLLPSVAREIALIHLHPFIH